jgi:putative cell wall-binding protein
VRDGEPVNTSVCHGSRRLSAHVQRTSGRDRYDTAAQLAAHDFATGARNAVVASGHAFADALAAAPLAASLDAPVLLTAPDRLSDATAATLRRLGVRDVVLLGGAAAIAPAVEEELRALGLTTRRVSGRDRYETAAAVATAVAEAPEEVVLVSGERFADALAAGAFAASRRVPLLLTPRDQLHAATRASLAGVARVLLVGGPSAVSQAVEDEVARMCDGGAVAPVTRRCIEVTRLAGRTRAETAVRVAEHAGWSPPHTHLGRGDAFPDLLAGAAHAAAEQGPVLVTDSAGDLGEATRRWLRDHRGEVETLHVFGGAAALPHAVVVDAARATLAEP